MIYQKKVILALFAAVSLVTCSAAAESLFRERGGKAPIVNLPNFADVADQVVPAVVSISVEAKVRTSKHRPRGGGPAPFDFFHRFFDQMPPEHQNKGLGTGFVIREDGLVLTNNHVVEKADSIELTFVQKDGSKRTVDAKVLGTAPEYDVALLQAQTNDRLPSTYLGDSDETRIGEWVMAVGNPFGLSHSVSVGIVSAKERRNINPSGRRGLYDFIQTDASINPGNSGGPLVNMRGEVIGINTAINAAGDGIGFAIPINMVKAMLPQLKSEGKYNKSWIGVRIQPVTEELAKSYGLKRVHGALVAEVVDNSPAEKAGLKEGDIITNFDGKPVRSSSDLPIYASMAGVGKRVSVGIIRNGKSKVVGLTLAAFKADEEAPRAARQQEGEIGILISDITPNLQQRFGVERKSGVVIEDVARGSVAARSGLRPGDVVLSINGKPVRRAREFTKIVNGIKSGNHFRLQIERAGQGRLFVAVQKP